MGVLDGISIIFILLILIIFVIKIYKDEKNSVKKPSNIVCEFSGELLNSRINEENKSEIEQFFSNHSKKIWLFLIVIVFFTVIYKFGEIPTYVGVDEIGMAYDAYCISEYGTDRYGNQYPLYLTNFGQGQSVLCTYLTVLFYKIIGVNTIAFRLPVLLIYILSVLASYLIVTKLNMNNVTCKNNKKMAFVFIFLILTCPWNIVNARQALDCNLFAGMLMISLYFMIKAKKSYQFFISGIFIGLTLYTYCLAWITIPIFLIGYIIYMLYLKKINIKQIFILGLPIAILAFPLIYFILLNYGIVQNTNLGIFSLPILSEFRVQDINFFNIFKEGISSIKTIFMGEQTIYPMYIPLFIIGYIWGLADTIKSIKKKEFNINAIMVITFTTILLGLLTTKIPTANKANALYIPILYFVAIAILNIARNSKFILIAFFVMIMILFINFEYYYYTVDGIYMDNWYEDRYLMDITRKLEENEETKSKEKYLLVNKSSPYIYSAFVKKVSPQEFKDTYKYKQIRNSKNNTKSIKL